MFKWLVRYGNMISFWKDSWWNDKPQMDTFQRLFELANHKNISVRYVIEKVADLNITGAY